MDNAAIARAFDELADLLDLAGESPFKSRAYRLFADTARGLERPLSELAAGGELLSMEGVGKAIAGKVDELLQTGTCAALERARADVPVTLLEILRVPGLGAKTVRKLWLEAHVTTVPELALACEEGVVARLSGFGARKQEKILEGAREALEGPGSMPLAMALEVGRRVRSALTEAGVGAEALVVGGARRGVDIVRDLRILVRGAAGDAIASALDERRGALACSAVETKGDEARITYEGGQRARVRGVSDAQWLARVIRETGSGAHVRWLEGRAAAQGGLERVCAKATSEEDVYRLLDLPSPPPELREGPTPELPDVVGRVHGVFHVHTDFSDGADSILGMARSAEAQGFAYVGISDHSKAAVYANGLDGERLETQRKVVATARGEVPGVRILHGVEVDILGDGALDLDDATLAELDFVIASVHAPLGLSRDAMTARVVRAVSHPLVTMLGHPTGRLLLGRRGYAIDLEAVARAAAANDTFLEINANANRLDLSEVNVRRAAAQGARFVINPDAHTPEGLAETPMGLSLARRAGLRAEQVLNARGTEELVSYLAARRESARKKLARS